MTKQPGERNLSVFKIDQIRNDQVRRVRCPVCAVMPGDRCEGSPTFYFYSHTGRYLLAASMGLVPLLPGDTEESTALKLSEL